MKTEKEKQFVDELCKKFNKTFTILREVKSQCKTSRIDIVLIFENKYFFGIECKIPDKKRGEEIGKYFDQAHRYTKLKWNINNEFKKIPILICPPISYNYFILNEKKIYLDTKEYDLIRTDSWHRDRHDELCKHHSFNGFAGVFNIGEVRKIENGYHFVVSNKQLFIYKSYYKYGHKDKIIESRIHEENYLYHINKINAL